MYRIIVGLTAVGLLSLGGLMNLAEEQTASRCTASVNVNLMPVAGQPRQPVIDCRGRPAGPKAWPTLDDIPEPHVDVDVNY